MWGRHCRRPVQRSRPGSARRDGDPDFPGTAVRTWSNCARLAHIDEALHDPLRAQQIDHLVGYVALRDAVERDGGAAGRYDAIAADRQPPVSDLRQRCAGIAVG